MTEQLPTGKEVTTNTTSHDGNDKESYNNNSNVTLVLLLGGLPGAGKSTLAAAWREALQPLLSLHCVEYDGLEEDLFLASSASSSSNTNNNDGAATLQEQQQQRLDAWKQSRTLALERLRDMLATASPTSARDDKDDDDKPKKENDASLSSLEGAIQQIILMDDNYYLKSMRKQVFMTCQQVVAERHDNKIAMVSVWLDTPVDTCLARNELRDRKVPSQVIERMARQMESPEIAPLLVDQKNEDDDDDETTINKTGNDDEPSQSLQQQQPRRQYHWEKVAWRLSGTASLESNTQYLLHQLRQQRHWLPQCIVPPPVDPQVELNRLAAERERTASNRRHNLDQALRKAVKMVATEISPQHARAANAARKQVLAAANDGDAQQGDGYSLQVAMQSFYRALLQNTNLDAQEEKQLQKALFRDQSW